VTRNVLLPLFEDVILLEPVQKFVEEAYRSAREGEWRDLPSVLKKEEEGTGRSKEGTERRKEMERRLEDGKRGRGKRIWFVKGGLQDCEPKFPGRGGEGIGVVDEALSGGGGGFGQEDGEVVYDV